MNQMETITLPSRKPDASVYWNLLKDLSSEIKLDLISRLSASLLKRETDDVHWASEFAGKWKDDRSAEEIVTDIREARTTNREIEL